MPEFFKAVKARRSVYALGKKEIVSKEKIEKIAGDALLNVPSAFNSQSTRIALLWGGESDRFWDIVIRELGTRLTREKTNKTADKINYSFRSGYGTLLFFEDADTVKRLAEEFPLYAENFPIWSQHTNAMHQFVIWTALEAEGLGASLQHYNPVIDDAVKREWNIPKSWQLIAQMPFGKPLEIPAKKEKEPVGDRLLILG